MDEVTVVPATPAQAQQLRREVAELGARSPQIAQVILKRMAWWQAVKGVAGQYDIDLRSLLGPELIEWNETADQGAHETLVCMLALDLGAAEIVGVQTTGGQGNLILGILPRGVLARHMQAWPLMLYVLVGTTAALTAYGVRTISKYIDVKYQESLATRAHEANVAKQLELVDKATAAGKLDQLKPILAQINAADQKAQQSIMDSVSAGVSSFASGVVKTATSGGIGLGVIALIAAYFLLRKGRA